MSQVIVNIIVAILGMAIGFIVCSKVVANGLFQKFYSGFLNVTIDPEDGQVYMSLGLDKQPKDICKSKFALFCINKIDPSKVDTQNKQTP